ncbi:MAG: alkene reductase [Chitinophagales bacterium]|nr:alkene reductase [Chitinophagales bacterium]
MKNQPAFSPYQMGNIQLNNRIVMAPMTRSRAIGNVPNDLMADFYAARASAGLLITEGTSPSKNGLGYARIPGIFSQEQVAGWKKVTDAVHAKGGKIFLQVMHTGRVTHPLNLPAGGRVLAPSAIAAKGEMWTDAQGMQAQPVPHAFTKSELAETKQEYVDAAKNAVAASFDGIELHGANGYLLEQFLSPFSNTRGDEYGGSIENRARFVIEVAQAAADAIGKEKVAIRVSPYGVYNDMPLYEEIDQTYTYLAEQLNRIGIAYIHIVDHSSQGAPEVPWSIKQAIRKAFKNTLILSGGYDLERANADIDSGAADLVAFGRPFINNPDLIARFQNGWPLNTEMDFSTFYTPGEKGYTDYPVYQPESATA